MAPEFPLVTRFAVIDSLALAGSGSSLPGNGILELAGGFGR